MKSLRWYFPSTDKIYVNEAQNSRKVSIWLGVSQALLNLPRIFLRGVIIATLASARLILMAIIITLLEVVMAPIWSILVFLHAGFSGRLSNEEPLPADALYTRTMSGIRGIDQSIVRTVDMDVKTERPNFKNLLRWKREQ